MEKKFHLGDHIMLTCKGDHGNPEYGLRGIVIDYGADYIQLFSLMKIPIFIMGMIERLIGSKSLGGL